MSDVYKELSILLNRETIKHSKRVAEIAKILASECGIDTQKAFEAGLWHDVGKSKMLGIISKTGSLSKIERKIINKHPQYGNEIIERIYKGSYKEEIMEVALMHHLRIDGSGYPQIPNNDKPSKLAQIISIADCFEAITAKRTYKKAIPPHEGKEKIIRGDSGFFSEEIINLFLSNYDKIISRLF